MSLHLISEDMIEEDADSENEEEEDERENEQCAPPGLMLMNSPPGLESSENTSNVQLPEGLGFMGKTKKLDDVKEGDEEVGTEEMPSEGVDTSKRGSGALLKSDNRSATKQHRRSMARLRRSSQTAVDIPSFESAGKKASRQRMLMEEEDNIMQIIHEKDLQASA